MDSTNFLAAARACVAQADLHEGNNEISDAFVNLLSACGFYEKFFLTPEHDFKEDNYLKAQSEANSLLKRTEQFYKENFFFTTQSEANALLKRSEQFVHSFESEQLPQETELGDTSLNADEPVKRKAAGTQDTICSFDDEENAALTRLFEQKINNNPAKVTFDDIICSNLTKELIAATIIYPKTQPQLVQNSNNTSKTLLLFGPPGTGKTQLALAIANEVGTKFMQIMPGDLLSKWTGESDHLVQAMFKVARKNTPITIFIDELETLFASRDDEKQCQNIQASLLSEMQDYLLQGITLIGGTNLPYKMDKAFLSRFHEKIYVRLPGDRERCKIFSMHYSKERSLPTPSLKEVQQFIEATEGWSGRDLVHLVECVTMLPTRAICHAKSFEPLKIKQEGQEITKWVPSQTKGGKKLEDIDSNHIVFPQVTWKDIIRCAHQRQVDPPSNLDKLEQYSSQLCSASDDEDEDDHEFKLLRSSATDEQSRKTESLDAHCQYPRIQAVLPGKPKGSIAKQVFCKFYKFIVALIKYFLLLLILVYTAVSIYASDHAKNLIIHTEWKNFVNKTGCALIQSRVGEIDCSILAMGLFPQLLMMLPIALAFFCVRLTKGFDNVHTTKTKRKMTKTEMQMMRNAP